MATAHVASCCMSSKIYVDDTNEDGFSDKNKKAVNVNPVKLHVASEEI